MAEILIRKIDFQLKTLLQARAKKNGRNLEDEVWEILHRALDQEELRESIAEIRSDDCRP